MKKKNKKAIRQNSTISLTKNIPTPAMRKWLAAAIDLGSSASISQIATAAKVDRTSWYLWIEKSEFVEWWDEAWKKHIKLIRHKLDIIGIDKAKEDYRYWKDMQNLTGNPIIEQSTQPIIPIQNNNNNIVLSPEDLARLTKD